MAAKPSSHLVQMWVCVYPVGTLRSINVPFELFQLDSSDQKALLIQSSPSHKQRKHQSNTEYPKGLQLAKYIGGD